MRVLIAPDSFTGTLSAVQAADAIARGWLSESPDDLLDLAPLSDGGPGFAAAMTTAIGGQTVSAVVRGPDGQPIEAAYSLSSDESIAFIESAAACGLHLIPAEARDPSVMTSAGVGELISDAIGRGCRTVIVGVGGTGSCDGGAGLLAALDATAFGADGQDLSTKLWGGAVELAPIERVDLAVARERVAGVDLLVATDVDVPLLGTRGAARGFAPQKGATPEQVEQLEVILSHWAGALPRVQVDGVAKDPGVLLGAGAGGGIGCALLAIGARRVAGIDTVIEAAHIPERSAAADLVITAEGSFDWQSLRGKVVAGVARAALEQVRPVLVLAGRVEVGRREWSALGISATYSCVDEAGDLDTSLRDPGEWLARTAARAARSWSRS